MRTPLLTVLFACLLTPAASAMSFFPAFDYLEANQPPQVQPPTSGMADRVVMKKAERRLYLMQGDRPIRAYEIALGTRPAGHKRLEGDGRTPEGRYILDSRNARSRYYKSLHLSYPNARDRIWARARGGNPGGLIMIHGQPNGRAELGRAGLAAGVRDWTFGCIAVSNLALDDIWSLTVDGTPIEILP